MRLGLGVRVRVRARARACSKAWGWSGSGSGSGSIMLGVPARTVGDVHGAAADGARGGVDLRVAVCGLEPALHLAAT